MHEYSTPANLLLCCITSTTAINEILVDVPLMSLQVSVQALLLGMQLLQITGNCCDFVIHCQQLLLQVNGLILSGLETVFQTQL